MTPPVSNDISSKISAILAQGWSHIPENLNGTGAAGMYLERLFGSENDNLDIPDLRGWEIKYHGGGTNLLTLFHKEPKPIGHQRGLIEKFGRRRENGETTFRHTIRGGSKTTNLGFYISVEPEIVAIKNINDTSFAFPYWSHDEILTSFLSKLRRLIFIMGQTQDRMVLFEKAYIFEEPRAMLIINAVRDGIIAIDFDMKIRADGTIRNHGTKFRIKADDLQLLYVKQEIFKKS